MTTLTPELLQERSWDVLNAVDETSLAAAVSTVKDARGKAAVTGRSLQRSSRLVHAAFMEANLFQLTLKPEFKPGDMVRKVRHHKTAFDDRPDAVVIEDIGAWTGENLREVSDWVKKRKVPMLITVAPETSSSLLAEKLDALQ